MLYQTKIDLLLAKRVRPSNRRLPAELKTRAMALVRKRYAVILGVIQAAQATRDEVRLADESPLSNPPFTLGIGLDNIGSPSFAISGSAPTCEDETAFLLDAGAETSSFRLTGEFGLVVFALYGGLRGNWLLEKTGWGWALGASAGASESGLDIYKTDVRQGLLRRQRRVAQ